MLTCVQIYNDWQTEWAVDQCRLKSLQREVARAIWELESESQSGNSG